MLVRVAVALLLMVLGPSIACAEKRVALVIGNGAYTKVGALTNPPRDAEVIQSLLRAAGFSVEAKRDLGLAAMRRALRDFSDQVRDADIAAVFFAGHGIEVNGANYLIPVDAILERDTDVEDETVSLERITLSMEQAKRLRLVILDACRDNPFVRSMKRTISSRSIGRGLAEVRVLTSDTMIAFAAKAGSTAADGEGSNSPYTLALVKHLTSPGLDLRLALGRVRDEVLKTTANRQEPHYYGSLGGAEIALMLANQNPPASNAAQGLRLSEAREAWDSTRDTNNIAVLEKFIARYKATFYADLAQARLEELKKQQVAVAAPPTSPVTASFAQSRLGTAAEAKAMLEQAVAAVKADKVKALDMMQKGEGGFKDRDLFAYCVNASDGIITAHPAVKGKNMREIKDKNGKAIGEEIMKVATEGKVEEVSYVWPRLGADTTPVPKVSFVTKVGDQVCGVAYYK